VQRLLGMKPIIILIGYAWMLSSYIKFWTTLAPLVLFFANVLEILFQNSFANSQRYMNKIFEKHFQDLKFSPPVSNVFPLSKQNSSSIKISS
jgi:hypothetical protein